MDPKQIKMLIDSGKLTPDDIKLFTPQEKAIYDKLSGANDSVGVALKEKFPDLDQQLKQYGMKGGNDLMVGGPQIAGLVSKAIPSASELGQILKMMGIGAGIHYGSQAVGIPRPIADAAILGTTFGNFAKGGRGVAATEEASSGALSAAERAALEKKGFPGDTIKKIEDSLAGRVSRKGVPVSSNVTKTSPMNANNDDLIDRYKDKGVSVAGPDQISPEELNDVERKIFGSGGGAAESRAFGTKPAPYPSNVSTQPSDADIEELYTRSSSKGAPSPLMFHDDDELKKAIEALKKSVKRRSPQ